MRTSNRNNRNSRNNSNHSNRNSQRNTNSNRNHNNHNNHNNQNSVSVVKLTFRGKTVVFKFKIKKDEFDGFKIYILQTPKPIDRYGMHQAHYLTDLSRPYICWDSYIKSYKDANAIMFIWAKNFINNCLRQDISCFI